jgi:hypothetical protein
MRIYLTDLDGELHDIRGQQSSNLLVYHPEDDATAQHLARMLRAGGEWHRLIAGGVMD